MRDVRKGHPPEESEPTPPAQGSRQRSYEPPCLEKLGDLRTHVLGTTFGTPDSGDPSMGTIS